MIGPLRDPFTQYRPPVLEHASVLVLGLLWNELWNINMGEGSGLLTSQPARVHAVEKRPWSIGLKSV